MTLYQFNLLRDEEEKRAAVSLNGELIAIRKEGQKNFFLYQLGSFYVEISDSEVKGEVNHFRSFTSLDQLKPYLDDLDITEITS